MNKEISVNLEVFKLIYEFIPKPLQFKTLLSKYVFMREVGSEITYIIEILTKQNGVGKFYEKG
ncbi:MAG: hypothetical protein RR929_03615 [Erysipelotrichaceae bacterium]